LSLRVREALREGAPSEARSNPFHDDLAAITRLVEQLGYPSSESAVAGRLERLTADPGSWVFVALDGERVVGLASVHVMPILERDDPTARITAMVVEEAARRSGVGRTLLERMEEVARAEGCGRIYLTTRYEREGAIAFYRRMGFEDTSLRFVKNLGT
jgi:ribosomal protein S18 acetylase RimI-like enzyme